MTWDITIGQRAWEEDVEDGITERWEIVRHETHPYAPVFEGDELTGQSNYRCISIGNVQDFLQETGLEWLDYSEGVTTLTQERYSTIYEALITYRHHTPDPIPGWGDGQNPVLARLEWLNWWCYYALSKYKDQAAINVSF